VSEELSEQNEARHDWIEQLGAQNRSVSSKWYQQVADLTLFKSPLNAHALLSIKDDLKLTPIYMMEINTIIRKTVGADLSRLPPIMIFPNQVRS